jgi:hypothetical protein
MRNRRLVMRLQSLHRVLGFFCLAFVGLIVVGNAVLHTPPGGLGYFKRGDVMGGGLFRAATQ